MKYLWIMGFVLFFGGVSAQVDERFSDEGKNEEKKEAAQSNSSTTQPSSASSPSTPRRSSGNSKLDKWRFGGMVGASFGTYTYVELSPRVHYLVQDNLGIGTGISYYYWKDNQSYPPGFNVKTEGSVYGLNFFGWYNPIGSIILQGEFEPLNFEVFNYENQVWEREWVNGLLLGGGIRQQAGRANMFFVVLYNVLYDVNRTFYSSPWVIRIGAGF